MISGIENEILRGIAYEGIKRKLVHDFNSEASDDIIEVLLTPWSERGYYYGTVRTHKGNRLQVFKPDGTIEIISTYGDSQLKKHQIVKVVYFEDLFYIRSFMSTYDFSKNGSK